MLTYEDPNHFFIPSMWFLTSRFCIYGEGDDEQKDKQTLQKYNPENSNEDLLIIVDMQVKALHSFLKLSYRHAFSIFHLLETELQKSNIDYSIYFEDELEEDIPIYMPWHLSNERAKEYFELLLSRLKVEWKDAIEKASKEDPSTW